MQYEWNDYELLYMIYQNSDIAWQLLIQKYKSKMRLLIRSYLQKYVILEEEQDCYQIALIKLVYAVYSYREDKDSSFSYYLETILRHALVDYVRSMKNQTFLYDENDALLEYKVQEEKVKYENRRLHHDMNGKYISREDILYQLMKNSDCLKPIELKIIYMRLEGYTYKQIADRFSISVKKVDNTLQKLRCKKID